MTTSFVKPMVMGLVETDEPTLMKEVMLCEGIIADDTANWRDVADVYIVELSKINLPYLQRRYEAAHGRSYRYASLLEQAKLEGCTHLLVRYVETKDA